MRLIKPSSSTIRSSKPLYVCKIQSRDGCPSYYGPPNESQNFPSVLHLLYLVFVLTYVENDGLNRFIISCSTFCHPIVDSHQREKCGAVKSSCLIGECEARQQSRVRLLSLPALESWTRFPSFTNTLLYAAQVSGATATQLQRALLISPPSPAAQLLC